MYIYLNVNRSCSTICGTIKIIIIKTLITLTIFFQGHSQDAGRIGLVIVLAGTLGSVISGFVLDKTGKYK